MKRLWFEDRGQDVAEYAVMLAVILAITIGVIKLMASNLNPIWTGVASQISGGQ